MSASSSSTSRSAADRCPGVLRLAAAADGLLARVRLPGGLVSSDQLRVLARLADELGDGRVELTSRGNIQLRGLAVAAAEPLTSELKRAGLLPSLGHDRVRNVLASSLAGLDGSPGVTGTDLTGVVRAFDAALCARPRLTELSGRFLFAIDDGRGDVAGLDADVVASVQRDDAFVNGLSVRAVRRPDLPDGDARGARVMSTDAPGTGADGVADGLRDAVVAAMLAFAEAFLDLRAEHGSTAWRIADLPGGPGRIRSAVAARLGLDAAGNEPYGAAAVPPSGFITRQRERDGARASRPVGLISRQSREDRGESPPPVLDNPEFSVVLLAPLGRLTSAQISWIAHRATGGPARITPWRSVVLPRLPDAAGVLREAAGLGFGTDEASPWLRLTACAGRPGCASALADVQADAAGFAARWPGRVVHVSGCDRHCGRPAATEIDVTATSKGYQVASG